jgi:hypothetical protein
MAPPILPHTQARQPQPPQGRVAQRAHCGVARLAQQVPHRTPRPPSQARGSAGGQAAGPARRRRRPSRSSNCIINLTMCASAASATPINLHRRHSSAATLAHQLPRHTRARARVQPRGETCRKICLAPRSRAPAHMHSAAGCAASVPGASAISVAPDDPLVCGETSGSDSASGSTAVALSLKALVSSSSRRAASVSVKCAKRISSEAGCGSAGSAARRADAPSGRSRRGKMRKQRRQQGFGAIFVVCK